MGDENKVETPDEGSAPTVLQLDKDSVTAIKDSIAAAVAAAVPAALKESGLLDVQRKDIHSDKPNGGSLPASPMSVMPYMVKSGTAYDQAHRILACKHQGTDYAEAVPNEVWHDLIVGICLGKDYCRIDDVKFLLSPEGQARIKAMVGSSDAAGGYAIPTGFAAEIIALEMELSELFPYVTVEPVLVRSGNRPREDTAASATWDDTENSENSAESDPTLGQFSWTAHKCKAFTYVSDELEQESPSGIANFVKRRLSEIFRNEIDKVLAIGNGSTQPTGLYSSSDISAVSGVTGTLTFKMVRKLRFGLKNKWIQNDGAGATRKNRSTRFVCNQATWGWVEGLEDTAGNPVFKTDPNSDAPVMPFGFPPSIQDNMPDGHIIFGNLRHYQVSRLEQITIASDNGGDNFRKDRICIKARQRLDGNLTRGDAFKKNAGLLVEPS